MLLYDVAGSPNCRKVRVLARELGLPLQIVPIALTAAKEADYLTHNPVGKVPTLVDDDGFVLWESGAILVYLADKRPEAGLLSDQPKARADVLRWLFFNATHLQPWLSLLGQERVLKARAQLPPDPHRVALAEGELARFLAIVDQQLEAREFLIGPFSLADIALGCGLEDCEARGVRLEDYARLHAWRARLRARPAWFD